MDKRTNFDGLSSNLVDRTSRPHLPFITNHMPQPLIVNHPDINICFELLSSNPRVHWLIPMIVISSSSQLFTKVIRRSVVFREIEGSSILSQAVHRSCFGCYRFYEHSYCHSRRESVRIDDDIRLHAGFGEGHIDGWVFLRTNSFLSMSRREFVSNDGRSSNSKFDVNFLSFCVGRVTSCKEQERNASVKLSGNRKRRKRRRRTN